MIIKDWVFVLFGVGLVGCGTSKTASIVQGALTLEEDGTLISGWGTTVANTCEGVKVLGPIASDLAVTLTMTAAAGSSFYSGFSNLECQGSLAATTTTVTLAAGSGANTVYFKPSPAATTVQIDATAAGTPAIPSLSFTVWPVVIQLTPDQASGGKYRDSSCVAIKVQNFVPAKGDCLAPDGLVTVALALKAGVGAALYSDQNCSKPAASFVIDGVTGGGSCGGTVWLKDPVAGDTAVVTGTAAGYTQPITATLQFL